MLNYSLKRLPIILVLLSIMVSAHAQQQTYPYVDTEKVLLLTTEEEGWLYYTGLSPSGRYVSGVWYPRYSEDQVSEAAYSIYLWDLEQIDPTFPVLPAFSKPFGQVSDEIQAEAHLSPDERHLAVAYSDGRVELLNVPDLDIAEVITLAPQRIPAGRSLAWSFDGNLLAIFALAEEAYEIVVWDLQSNELYRHPLEHSGFRQPFGDGWLIDRAAIDKFTVCTRLLKTCNVYEYPFESGGAIFPDSGTLLLGQNALADQESRLGLWTCASDATCTLDEEKFQSHHEDFGLPIGFSSTGQYVIGARGGIWDFSTLEPIQELAQGGGQYHPVWLPQDQYFVRLSRFLPENDKGEEIWDLNLRLYHLSQEEAVDIGNLEERHNASYDIEALGIVGVSTDGQRLLVNLGIASLVVPIVYEEIE